MERDGKIDVCDKKFWGNLVDWMECCNFAELFKHNFYLLTL